MACKLDIASLHSDEEDTNTTYSDTEAFDLPNCALSSNVFDKSLETLNVVDVYSIASSVGQEFERLTDAFGGAVFAGVMPKIIRILEMLEGLVTKKEKESNEIIELNSSLQKLQMDSKLKDEKQQQEIEIIESCWKDETRGLLETVAILEEDNKKLTGLLNETLQEDAEERNNAMSEQQSSVINKFQEQVAKQRDEIRSKSNIIEQQSHEADALQSQIQRLTKLNVGLRNKVHVLEQQGKALVEQKVDLENRLSANNQHLTEVQLRSFKNESNSDSLPAKESSEVVGDSNEADSNPLDPLLANKLVIDLRDPNRPRYTLSELQEVLTDRNQLKARCFLLEEELMFHRGDESWVEVNETEINASKKTRVGDPVKPAESGIRRLLGLHVSSNSFFTSAFHYLIGDSTWLRNQPNQPTGKHEQHHIVEASDGKNLIRTSDIKELLPDLQQPNVPEDYAEELAASEMKVLSSNEELNDLSP